MQKLPYVDGDRLGIGGWSYGGILTDYTIATDGRFKAATSGAGSALQLSMYGVDEYITQYQNEIGPPWKSQDLWIKISYPFFHADRIKTPTLFLGGDKDFNVPLVGGEQMYQALKSLGVDTQLVIYPGQFHGITTPTYKIDRYQRYLDWYAEVPEVRQDHHHERRQEVEGKRRAPSAFKRLDRPRAPPGSGKRISDAPGTCDSRCLSRRIISRLVRASRECSRAIASARAGSRWAIASMMARWWTCESVTISRPSFFCACPIRNAFGEANGSATARPTARLTIALFARSTSCSWNWALSTMYFDRESVPDVQR